MLPATIDGVAGVTAMDTTVGAVTVNAVDPEIPPEVAVIVAVPAATAVASPAELMVTTVAEDEDQLTVEIAAVWPSLYVPVAVNCCVAPCDAFGLAGETEIETSWTVGGGGVGVELPPPPQPINADIKKRPMRKSSPCNLRRIGSYLQKVCKNLSPLCLKEADYYRHRQR